MGLGHTCEGSTARVDPFASVVLGLALPSRRNPHIRLLSVGAGAGPPVTVAAVGSAGRMRSCARGRAEKGAQCRMAFEPHPAAPPEVSAVVLATRVRSEQTASRLGVDVYGSRVCVCVCMSDVCVYIDGMMRYECVSDVCVKMG